MPQMAGKPQAKSASSLGHMPKKSRWEFDQTVANVFDDMLRRSIPQYEVMRSAVHEVARRFAKPGTDIIDLGCSRGETLAPLVDEFGDRCRYIACDVSQPMLEVCRAEHVDAILPQSSFDLLGLAEAKSRFEGIAVLVSSPEASRGHFSGSATNSAPSAAAARTCRSAASTLRAFSLPELSCTTAARKDSSRQKAG